MGLDLLVLSKPKAGYDVEFRCLMARWFVHAEFMTPVELCESDFLEIEDDGSFKLGSEEVDDLRHRIDEISIPAFANLGAPRVGAHPEADDWVRSAFSEGRFPPDITSAEAALRAMTGYYVLELLPDMDGLPAYSNAFFGDVDRTSFRGAFLEDCKDILSEEQRLQVWGAMWADDLLSYGQELSEAAQKYATEHGLTEQIGQQLVDWQVEGEPRAQLHIVDSLARWAVFWGGRGHGSEPYF